jgi:hypothetical protein
MVRRHETTNPNKNGLRQSETSSADIKRAPLKLDNKNLIRLPSKAVKLSQKDQANSTGSTKQSKLSFNRNANISSLKINSRASSLLQPNPNKDRNGNCTIRSNSKDNSNKKADNNNNNNQSKKEGNTKTDSNSPDV